ncbi:MAG: CHAD domain-containing protein [Candidatus Sedimenticola sp. (ex Thyasira tokunagai)]
MGREMIYSASEELSLKKLKSWLADDQAIRVEPEETVSRVYLDTVDWRLFKSGSVLEMATRDQHHFLTWRKLKSGEVLTSRTLKKVPHNANDFLGTGLRHRLKEVLGERTLMRQLFVRSSTCELHLLNSEEKTLMRVELRQDRPYIPHSSVNLTLPACVYLFPYRGYDTIYQKKLNRLTAKGRLKPIGKDPLTNALNLLGIVPEAQGNRSIIKLSPKQSSFQALATVLNDFRRSIADNIEGVRNEDDPEFLHDLLLSTRRTLCLLSRFSAIFPPQQINLIKQDFEWIEEVATPVRDLDIHFGLIDDLATHADSEHRAALKPLIQFLKKAKQKEQRSMRIALESPRYIRLMDNWKSFLEQKHPSMDLPVSAGRPILESASESLLKIYQEITNRWRTITPESNSEQLHELHKDYKRLGYQLEIFQSLYPKKKLASVIDALKPAKESLDTFFNLDLQRGSLADYQKRMKEEQKTIPLWLEKIDQLDAKLARKKRKVWEKFLTQSERLSQKKVRKQFLTLFSDKGKKRGFSR